MFRSFKLLAPRPGIGLAEFHDHWRHPHGTMGRRIPGMESLVQAHRVDSAHLGPAQDGFGGVAILSVDDSPAGMAEGFADPQYVEGIVPRTSRTSSTSSAA